MLWWVWFYPQSREQCTKAELSTLQVYEAYKRGVDALKSLKESSGFTVDDVDEIAVSLQDALEANQDISEALSQGIYDVRGNTHCTGI